MSGTVSSACAFCNTDSTDPTTPQSPGLGMGSGQYMLCSSPRSKRIECQLDVWIETGAHDICEDLAWRRVSHEIYRQEFCLCLQVINTEDPAHRSDASLPNKEGQPLSNLSHSGQCLSCSDGVCRVLIVLSDLEETWLAMPAGKAAKEKQFTRLYKPPGIPAHADSVQGMATSYKGGHTLICL